MADNVYIINDIEGNAKIISSEINSVLQKTLKQNALNYYAEMTNQEKRKRLFQYKQKFVDYKNKLEGSVDVDLYFQAYQFILEFRQFILGNLGKIDYTFTIRANSGNSIFMKTLTIGSVDFANLMKDKNGKVIGLQQSGNNLRFTSAFLNNLKALIKNIESQQMSIKVNSNCTTFTLINETLGTKQDFTSGKLFKSYIDAAQRKRDVEKWYNFQLTVKKDISAINQKNVFKYFITRVDNAPESSSIFSAIGKYFADEMNAKRNAVQESFSISIDPSYPNAGNLTELYILAKKRLNNGKNTFYPSPKPVSGQSLFEMYNQVRANTQPFYSGGDVLLEQIKSFLGSNPSLTSYSTIKKTIENFYNALNFSDIEEIKKQLSNLLLQKGSEQMSQEQKDLSLAISNSFAQFFKNLN